ncbi:TonB-dependent receptor [Capnocytophaga catalasegens]|uniref:TonB-dependent receptor n=1 Tax=Capnocytophaga catalasegens TaxID=1004260 RepID=UPI00403914C6
MITRWFFSVVLLFVATTMYSQGVINGTIYDNETKEPLPGANVLLKGTTQGASTDIDGHFSLKTTENKGTLIISYVSFEKKEVPFVISNGKATIRVNLSPDAQALSEVVVTGNALLDIAKERQTPVAVSTIKAAEIVEKLGNQEFPELLNRTPSVYATKAGGGFGDAKINIRGFTSENIAVMVNGMPINDMETGKVFWSNWAGISDVTTTLQVQRGLGASKLAIASIGGTINVVTRSAEMPEGGVFYAGIGNDDYIKNTIAYNTGRSDKGWSSSILLSRAVGSTYADATKFEGYNYFFALGYSPSEKHSLQFMITGAPQWHHQRSTSVSIADAIKYGGSKDKPNRRYNADWGYLDGKEYNIRRNVYHKPIMMLNWDWNMNENSALSTVIYASFGRGFGTGDLGRSNGKSLSNFRDVNTGLYKFDEVVASNQASDADKGILVRRASINSHNWFGILSNFNHKLTDNLTFNIGIDGRYYYGYHYQVLNDLLGGTSYKDTSNKNLSAPNYVSSTIKSTPDFNPFGGKIDPIENRITYSNDGEVRWLGAFGQLEYTNEKMSAFVQGSISNQGFQRIDEFLLPGTLARVGNPDSAMERKTGFENIMGYNIKGGLNYNINENHNVFANVGYYSKQPFFTAVYRSNQNYLSPDNTNEKILGIELGYGFKSQKFNANLNVYRTTWDDRYIRRSGLIDVANNRTRFYAELSGLNEVHQGIELDATYKITDYLRLNGMFSIGDWFYKDNASALTFDESNQPYTVTGRTTNELTLYMENAKVGDASQLTANAGLEVKPFDRLKLTADWRYVDNLYANIDIYAFSDQELAEKGTLKLPNYNLFDLGVSYKLPLVKKQTITFAFNLNNLLDTYYIAESYTNTHAKTRTDFTTDQQYLDYQNTSLYKGIDTSNRVYFGFGRTWNFSIRYAF